MRKLRSRVNMFQRRAVNGTRSHRDEGRSGCSWRIEVLFVCIILQHRRTQRTALCWLLMKVVSVFFSFLAPAPDFRARLLNRNRPSRMTQLLPPPKADGRIALNAPSRPIPRSASNRISPGRRAAATRGDPGRKGLQNQRQFQRGCSASFNTTCRMPNSLGALTVQTRLLIHRINELRCGPPGLALLCLYLPSRPHHFSPACLGPQPAVRSSCEDKKTRY
jgi:hypothetical protein